MLEARHLVKRFFGTAVVSDVSFEVRAGEVVGYLGPNGSGKSTTAKMLIGLLETSAGAVLFDGRHIAHDPVAFHRRLGYVPEEPNLYTFSIGPRVPRARPVLHGRSILMSNRCYRHSGSTWLSKARTTLSLFVERCRAGSMLRQRTVRAARRPRQSGKRRGRQSPGQVADLAGTVHLS